MYSFDVENRLDRARYERLEAYSAIQYTPLLVAGMPFADAPHVHVTFITRGASCPDMGGPIVEIARVPALYNPGGRSIVGPGAPSMEAHLIERHVDGSHQGKDSVARMLADIACPDPRQMHPGPLRDLVWSVKAPLLLGKGTKEVKSAEEKVEQLWSEQHEKIVQAYNSQIREAKGRVDQADFRADQADARANRAEKSVARMRQDAKALAAMMAGQPLSPEARALLNKMADS